MIDKAWDLFFRLTAWFWSGMSSPSRDHHEQ